MAKEYLIQLSALMKEATARRFTDVDLECKHFFSGAAVYVNGKICMSLTPVGFALKLPEGAREKLKKEKRAKPLRYFPNGPIKKDYVVLPKRMVNDVKVLRHWVKICIDHVVASRD